MGEGCSFFLFPDGCPVGTTLCMPHPLCALEHSYKLCAHPAEELLAQVIDLTDRICTASRER